MVRQYQRVYQATDYYIIGGKEMGTCFKESFEATEDQLLPLGFTTSITIFKIQS